MVCVCCGMCRMARRSDIVNIVSHTMKPFRKICMSAAFAAAFAIPDAALASDAYVESDGNQVLNTGYYVGPDTRIVADFQFVSTDSTGGARLFGVYRKGATVGFWYNADKALSAESGFGDSSAQKWLGVEADTSRHIVAYDCAAGTVTLSDADGGNARSWALARAITQTATSPLAIFTTTTGDIPKKNAFVSAAKIYSFRIYEGGELVHDFAPAIRDGLAGLHDAKTGLFLSALDVTGCVAPATDLSSGGDILAFKDAGYIEASKNAYFTTDYLVKPSTRIVADYAFTATSGNDGRLFGVYKKGASVGFYHNATEGSHRIESGTGSTLNNTYLYSIPPNTLRHTVTLDLDNGAPSSYVTGATTNWSGSLVGAVSADATAPLDIFTTSVSADGHSGSENTYRSYAKIYRLSIYEGDTLVHDYEPFVKNGVAGFRDTVNGGAFLEPFSGSVTYGGEIHGEVDAYVQAVRASKNAINTGYYVKPTTKFVVDFQYDDNGNDGRIFGSYSPPESRVGLYGNKVDGGMFRVESSGGELDTSVTRDTKRHVAVLDYSKANGGSSISTDGTAVWNGGPKGAVTAEGTNPVILFGTHTGTPGFYASAKIYSFKIYEGDSLVHEYLPYKNGDTVSFYDTVDEAVLANNAGTSTAFSYGGKGVDGSERWLKALPATATVPVEGTTTLTAAASGAIRYKWTKNGETIEGATGETCAASWRRGHYDTPDIYACTAIYDVYGREVEGEPVSCEVSRIPEAFVLVVR